MTIVWSPAAPPAPPVLADLLRAFLMRGAPASQAPVSGAAPCPAGLVDVRRVAPGIVALPAPPWSDPELRFLARPEVAERLARAAAGLPSDLRIGFWEGLRPLPAQRYLWEAGMAFLARTCPTAGRVELEAELERYVARPDGGTPPHSTGSAVDLAAVDVFGRVLNPNEAWGKLGNDIAARALRGTGLANYEAEWWHWSYGDAEWASAYDCAPLVFASPPEPSDGPGGGI